MPGNRGRTVRSLDFLRQLPLALLALLAGSIVYVANPGFFWDDWVWIHQEPAENIRIGKELGIWWAGYLSNAIYRTSEPVLLLRLVSLIAWAVSAGAVVYMLRLRNVIDKTESLLVFALLCATHIAGVRFLNSVAMYNVYIASFWLGCAFLVARPDKIWARLVAAFFFFFSFHLNSMLVVYGLVFALLFAEDIRRALKAESEDQLVEGGLSRPLSYWFKPAPYVAIGEATRRVGLPGLVQFIRSNFLFIILPFLFYGSVKMVSLAMSTVLSSQQRIYSDYNSIKLGGVLKAFVEIPKSFLSTLRQYFMLIIDAVPPILMLPFVAAAIACVLLIRRSGRFPTWHVVRFQFLMGFLLYAAAIYPYLLVGKPPVLFDFYEARNVLPAVPGLVLTILAAINTGAILVYRVLPAATLPLRNLAFAVVVGLVLSCQFVLGTDLMKDWIRQEAIASFATSRKAELDRFGTILMADSSTGFRANGRKIWNYEYTGLMINVFGAQTKLGISTDEFQSWPVKVPLLHDPIFRKRYNLSQHDPKQPQVIIEMTNSADYPELRDLFRIVRHHWAGKPVGAEAADFFRFTMLEQYTEAGGHLKALQGIQSALNAFKAETGIYPYTTRVPPGVATATPALGMRLPGQLGVPAYLNEFPRLRQRHGMACNNLQFNQTSDIKLGITQTSTEVCKIEVECIRPGCGYLYMSDGIDYKLVYVQPVDSSFVRQAYPELMDPMREGYGYWTPGAQRW